MKSSRGIEKQRRLTGISRLLQRRFLRILPSLAGMVVALSLLSSSLLLPSPAFASDSTVEGSSVTVPSGDTIITQFQSGHGFIHTSGPGSSQDDTGVFCQGNQSLRITTDGNGNQSTVVMKKNISPTIDLTGKAIKVVFMVDNSSRLSTLLGQIVFGFSSSNFSSDYIEMKATYTAVHQEPGGTWITTCLSQSGASVVGAPNLAAINSVRMYFRDGGTGPLNVWVQEIAYFTPNLDHGVVSFTFDDGYASDYTSALPVLSLYDYPATSYVARDNIGLSGSKWINLAQLQALQNTYGWDIAAHGDINLSTLNAADCEAEIQAIKAWLEANGFNGGDYLAYPNGGLNTNVVLPLVQKYFTNARLSNSQASETFPSGNQYALYSYAVTPAVTPAMVAARVAAAMANHDWLILTFHQIVNSGASGTVQYNLADFKAIVDNIHSQGIAVRSVSQVDKPAAPSDLQVTGATEDSISLSWTKGSSADYTTIVAKQGAYPENVTDGTQIYTGTGNSTVHTSLSGCSIWYYRAWSYNSVSGGYSTGYSSVIGATTCNLPRQVVITPATATIMAGGTQAYTSGAFDQYGNSLGDTTSATIFSVEVAAGGSWSGNVYTSEKEGTWTVTGDYNGQAVTATLTVNAASPAMTSVNPNQGYQGQTLSVAIAGNNLTGATSVNFGSGITINNYTVDSSTQITANITISGSATIGNRNVSVTTPGGTGTKSAGFTVSTPPPPAPTNVIATDGTYLDMVQISWTNVAGVTSYKVFRNTTNSSGTAAQIGTATVSPYNDTTAVVGTTYYYWVKATNASGDSGCSYSNIGWRASVAAPTNVIATDGTYSDKVQITWTNVVGATSYKVFRNTTNNSDTAAQIGTATVSPYNDTTAVVGTTYYYWVKATNASGDSGCSYSNIGWRASVAAPTNVIATDGTYSDKVQITWTNVVGATSYKVFRNTTNNSDTAAQIGTATVSPYNDTTAVVGTTYYYWVKATNASGDSGCSYSNIGWR